KTDSRPSNETPKWPDTEHVYPYLVEHIKEYADSGLAGSRELLPFGFEGTRPVAGLPAGLCRVGAVGDLVGRPLGGGCLPIRSPLLWS
ncbi:hypothetical protein, partial [Streptomyces sp. AS58]|uniref:hypothetical protein n=1 Tax=Streptomyces sp. AS58 TaxID=1519489 RepID=UPI001F26D663